MSGERILFAGPSIAGFRQSLAMELAIRPPCRQGDIYVATLEKPAVISIVDGYFEGHPSVWHKEVLWALSQGIHVVGAASMGALRAAELDSFGMVGLGRIYRWYRDREIEDDDEVALIHAPEEMKFRPLSLAMVNVRATCSRAVELNVLTTETSDTIIKLAKETFYKERTWGNLEIKAGGECSDADELKTAMGWLALNEIDQKELDARELCDFVVSAEFHEPFQPSFEFEETEFWYQNTRLWGKPNIAADGADDSGGYRLFT